MKKLICYALLMLILVFSGASFAHAEGSVALSSQKLTVNGTAVDCDKYNIDGSNYFKLRDLGKVLSGTGSQFSVGWSGNTVSIKPGEAYVADGSELAKAGDQSSSAKLSDATIEIDGAAAAGLKAYNIGGNNYFKLRDLGTALGFIVSYDAKANTMLVQSTKTVRVATSEELLNAIAPDTRLVLAAGSYDLTKADKGKVNNKYVSWQTVFDGEEVFITGVNNLIITGGADTASTLICVEPRYANVLNFSGCSNVQVNKLTVGHTIQEGYCTGGVLNFCAGSQNISVESCELYGCGTYGIITSDVREMNVCNTIIRDCTYGAINCQSSSALTFDSCIIHDCQEFSIVEMTECGNVLFKSCFIMNNSSASEWNAFFSFQACNNVCVDSSVISDNSMSSLLDISKCVNISFTNNSIQNNEISYGLFAKGSDENVSFVTSIK